METLHTTGDIIAERYQILSSLGQGGMGTTYEAKDVTQDTTVAIKAMSFRQITDWKVLELFEREAKILATLNHPNIPNYVDYFHLDTPDDRRFYLVRELVEGESLADRVEKGWHATEVEVKDIARQTLDILSYLHSLMPPVIHRDIKPQNIILTQEGKVWLVDFGSVQDVYRYTISRGGTFVGTIGYMPPEQFRGQVVPASDLYALGVTLIYLLTHHSPEQLPQRRMKLDFRPQVQISDHFAEWVEMLIEPAVEDRFKSASEALRALQGRLLAKESLVPQHRQPAGSRIKLKKTAKSLLIEIPSAGFRLSTVPIAIFALFWNVFMLFWWSGILLGGAPLAFILFSLPHTAVGLGFLGAFLFAVAGKTRLLINPKTFTLRWDCLGVARRIEGKTPDILRAEVTTSNMKVNGNSVVRCVLWEGIRQHKFGDWLTEVEREWLVAEISEFINKINDRH
ncbi:MAG: serine/threonine protein kinase [Chroococcales cyanobacterium]